VRWANPHGHICVGLDPTAKNTTAGKHEGVDPIEVDPANSKSRSNGAVSMLSQFKDQATLRFWT